MRETNIVGEIYGIGLPLPSHMWRTGATHPPRGGGMFGPWDRTGEPVSLSCSPALDIVRRVEKI